MVKKKPLLSILIPTYNHVIGIKRILYFFNDLSNNDIEILIYDNSPNKDTSHFMDNWLHHHPYIDITYKLNRPVTSPAVNWNNLIANAKGEYCLLLHNGELPNKLDFFSRLIEELNELKPDIALMNCILLDIQKEEAYLHLPILVKSLVVKLYPSFLFQRNVIGPSACLAIKRKLYANFDQNLNWLLDIDSYYRSILKSKKILFFKGLQIISIMDKNESLTAQFRPNLNEIEDSERRYLLTKYNKIFWFNSNLTILKIIILALEKITWKLLEFIYRLIQFKSKKVLGKEITFLLEKNDNN
jgi:hypothetical protein